MNSQLEILLQLQDLKAQHQELAEIEDERRVEEEEFKIDIDDALGQLTEKIDELEDELEPAIRGRYRRIDKERGRAVVPVINGTCYGCFVSIPTARTTEMMRHELILNCDNCGRFLYMTD